jgi:ATP-dependent RNA helicase DeaD
LLAPVEVDDKDRELGARLLAEKSPEDIAAALVNIHRSRLPEPEELIDVRADGQATKADGHRPGFDDIIWFKMDIGRQHNADPRWLLPLLCRRGHITRNEVGAIRIAQNETRFQIPRALAQRFTEAVKRTAGAEGEGEVTIIVAEGPPGPMDRSDGGANLRPDQRPRPRTGPGTRSGPPPARATIKPYAGKPKGPRKPR